MNLYLVTLQRYSFSFYVVAENTNEAYKKVKDDLDNKRYGYSCDRQLSTITLIAEEKDFPDAENTIKKFYLK